MTDEERKQKKKQAQHQAWKKWYDSEKGKAYRDKKKATRPLKSDP